MVDQLQNVTGDAGIISEARAVFVTSVQGISLLSVDNGGLI